MRPRINLFYCGKKLLWIEFYYQSYRFLKGNVCSKISSVYHHHHVVPLARISLTLSRRSSLSFIVPGRSSGLHPVSSYSCWMYVRAGRPAFARPYVGVHRSTSFMSSSLLLQQCPAFGRIVGALWGVASRTCSILIAAFFCYCRLASSPAVLLASNRCIHTIVLNHFYVLCYN